MTPEDASKELCAWVNKCKKNELDHRALWKECYRRGKIGRG